MVEPNIFVVSAGAFTAVCRGHSLQTETCHSAMPANAAYEFDTEKH